ncbi:MAG: XdhC family protein [Gemmatimonadota bacterium]
MKDANLAVWRAMAAEGAAGHPCALATIVDTRGSTPRKSGSRMLVRKDGSLEGTVGGGCGEAEVIQAAQEAMASGQPIRVRVDLTRDLMSWSPAVCGGIMDVVVEPIIPAPGPTS